MSRSGDSTLN